MESQKSVDVLVVGGGGAGIAAAIGASRKGASTLLCEKMPKLGKKVRISGNGRCNISNDRLDATCYNTDAKEIVESIFAQIGRVDILNFFKELGLRVYSDKEGRVFPITNQSTSVLDVLELELERNHVQIIYECPVSNIQKSKNGFLVETPKGKFSTKSVILCAGGKTYPVSGTDGSAYQLALNFGHTMVEPVPSTVALLVNDPWCNHLVGQKITATVRYEIKGKVSAPETGDFLFTEYGLSGLTVLDQSDEISIAIYRHGIKETYLLVDLVPFMHEDELQKELSRRLRKNFPSEKLLMGILPPKFSYVLKEVLDSRNPVTITQYVKNKKFKVHGNRGWNDAEFTAGGINHLEVDKKTLESKKCSGLFFAGEILDVDGKRGGFNLAWAWSSGLVAGANAAIKTGKG